MPQPDLALVIMDAVPGKKNLLFYTLIIFKNYVVVIFVIFIDIFQSRIVKIMQVKDWLREETTKKICVIKNDIFY